MKEFDQAKSYLQEKNAKLIMVAKTKERMALVLLRKSTRAEEETK